MSRARAHEAEPAELRGGDTDSGGRPGNAVPERRRALPGPRRVVTVHIGLLVVLVLAGMVSVSLGSVRLPLDQVWQILLDPLLGADVSRVREAIVWDSRLPRVVGAAVVGASLALTGALAQLATRNPMADPYLLGVSKGAGLAVSLLTVFGLGAGTLGLVTTPVAAFLGGLAALLVVLAVAGRSGAVTALILGGLAVGEIAGALTSLVLYLFANGGQVKQVMFWTTGGLGAVRWELLAVPAGVLAVALVAALAAGRWINLLHAGDDGATALGLNPRRFRLALLAAVSLVAGVSVSVAGGIAFVGLLVPHAASFLVGADARRVVGTSALLGAAFLVLADLASRVVVAPSELPVGVLTALAGGPLFLIMLVRYRKGSR